MTVTSNLLRRLWRGGKSNDTAQISSTIWRRQQIRAELLWLSKFDCEGRIVTAGIPDRQG